MSDAQAITIARDVGVQGKGFRLQKLRAAKLIIGSLSNKAAVHAYAAVEFRDDVYVVTATPQSTDKLLEQDKNFDSTHRFTFASGEFLKAQVNFVDRWIELGFSNSVVFGFYSNCTAGREINAGKVKALAIQLPSTPMLETMQKRVYGDPLFLPAAKALIVAEYEEQYAARTNKGNLETLKKWNDSTWIDFFNKIELLLGSEDDEQTEQSTLAMIRSCPLYDSRHVGKEELILSRIIDLFDKKQSAKDLAERFVHQSEVVLTFDRAATGQHRHNDPTWEQWEKLAPSDKRNLPDKIKSALPQASQRLIDSLARKVAASLDEQAKFKSDKNLRALKFHVFDECADLLAECENTVFQSDQQLRQRIDLLTQAAIKRVLQRAKTYNYPLENEDSIKGLVLSLFDSCFLAFTSEPHQ